MRDTVRTPGIGWLFFSPSGRAGRQVFILSWLFWMMANGYTTAKLVLHQDDESVLPFWSFLFFGVFVTSVVSGLMLGVKRLHDMGFTGLLAITLFVPVISVVVLLWMSVWPSEKGPNAYGPATDRPQK